MARYQLCIIIIIKYLETQSSDLEFYSAIYNHQGADAAVSM